MWVKKYYSGVLTSFEVSNAPTLYVHFFYTIMLMNTPAKQLISANIKRHQAYGLSAMVAKERTSAGSLTMGPMGDIRGSPKTLFVP